MFWIVSCIGCPQYGNSRPEMRGECAVDSAGCRFANVTKRVPDGFVALRHRHGEEHLHAFAAIALRDLAVEEQSLALRECVPGAHLDAPSLGPVALYAEERMGRGARLDLLVGEFDLPAHVDHEATEVGLEVI